MVHYPLSTLMAAVLPEILVITTPEESESFSRLLGDGSPLGPRASSPATAASSRSPPLTTTTSRPEPSP